jgi:3-oxoacyl-[acyl-carrier-protein] synthase II
MSTRVVVTGMGVVSPVGNGIPSFWEGICAGRSGVRLIDRFDTSQLPVQIAGLCDEVSPAGLTSKELRRLDRFTIYAFAAAEEAWAQAGIDMDSEDPFRCGVTLGCGIGGIETMVAEYENFVNKGAKRVSPLTVPKILINMPAAEIAIRLGLRGPNKAVVTACATGAHSLGEAVAAIRANRADVMIAGGTEAPIAPFGIACFAAMRALSRRNDAPELASRPFDADRDGFVMGEGAALLVIESEAHAKARGAEILGEVAGYGETCDAYHVAAPHPDGDCAAAAMSLALADAGVSKEGVGYFNAHGTSTKQNDVTETLALRRVFGEALPPTSSTKSMTGHLLGAVGALEAIACLLAIRDGVLPPSINYETPDPECVVNLVANEAREAKISVAMSNSLGFGGPNSCTILKRYD